MASAWLAVLALATLGTGVAAAGGGAFLTHVNGAVDGTGGVTALNEPYDVSLSPDGKFVYATSYAEDAITVLERAKPSENLSFVQTYQNGVGGVHDLDIPRSVKISPDNRFAYATATATDSLHILEHNDETGMIFADGIKFNGQNGVKGLSAPTDVVVSPDSKYVYVSGYDSDSIVIFKRGANGKHPYVGKVSGSPGLNGPFDLAVSRDGRNLYVVAQLPGAVITYKRNKSTGKLSHVQSLRDNHGSTDFIAGASGITVSRDGENVYVAAPDDSALSVFRRNASTGRLTLIQLLRDGVGGLSGFTTPHDVAVTPDGLNAYVPAFGSNALVAFTRKTTNGRLSYDDAVNDAAVGDLLGIWRVTADNNAVFGASIYDDAIPAFRRSD